MVGPLTPVVCPVLIGRSSVVRAIEESLAMAGAGSGQILVLAGEAGIGKSRLVTEARTRAAQQGLLVLEGRCFEPDRSLPYGPLLDLIHRYSMTRPPNQLAADLRPIASEMITLLPELATLWPDLAPASVLEPERDKRRLFRAIGQFLARLAVSQPVLVVIEDLHQSDETSLDALRYLAYRVSAQSVMLLLTYRNDETSPSLRHFLAELDRERLAVEVALDHFTPEEVSAMVAAIFGLERLAPTDLLDRLYALTDGNPFFVEEVLKSLIAAGDIAYAAGRWERKPLHEIRIPRSVQDAVWRRVEPLSQAARDMLSLAAVTGRQLDVNLLGRVAKMDGQQLLQVTQELVAAQLLVEVSADELTFRHALTREAVYTSLLRRERHALHGKIGQALEAMHAGSLDAHASELAYHFFEAGMWTEALAYAERAGEAAEAVYAPREAIQQFTRAFDAAQRLSMTPSPRLFRLRARAYETIGDFEAARRDYESALQVALAGEERREVCEALLCLGQLWASRNYEQTAAYFQRALGLARTGGDPLILARSLNRIGNWHANIEQPVEALRLHEEALGILQGSAYDQAVAETLDLLGLASQLNCDPGQAAYYYGRAVALFRQIGDRPGLSSSLAVLTILRGTYHSFLVGSIDALPEGAEPGAAVDIARAIDWRAGEAYALATLALYRGPRGDYTGALDAARTGLSIAEEIEHRQWMTAAHYALGWLYLDLLDLASARQHLEQALLLARETGSLVWCRLAAGSLAAVCVRQNEFDLAQSVVDAVLTPDAATQTQGQRVCWCSRADLALARHDPALALQIADRIISSAPGPAAAAERTIPRVWYLRAEALAMSGRFAEAEAIFWTLRAAALAGGAQSLLWRIDLSLGKLYHVTRHYSEARERFAMARRLVQDLASRIPDEPLRQIFLENALARVPPEANLTPLQAARLESGGLTEREREVAALIAEGKSNRAIAEALVVSGKTVEGHVSNILTKLGFTKRAQIAAWAVQRGYKPQPQ